VAVATWDRERLEVLMLPPAAGRRRTVAAFQYAAPPDARYDVVLRRDGADGWWLRAPLPRGSQFGHISGDRAELIPPPPHDEVIPLARCKIHARDVLTATGTHRLEVMRPGNGWRSVALPEEMRVEDVSFDAAGGLWLAGSVPVSRVSGSATKAAVRYQPPGSDRFERRPPRLGVMAALRTVPLGGLERFRTIDAEGDWKVATSDSPRLLDDPSSFVYAWRDEGYWTASRLRRRLVRRLVRTDGHPLVVTTDGGVYSMGGTGRLVQLSDGTGVRRLLSGGVMGAEPRLTIRDVCAGQEILAVAAGLSTVVEGRLSWLTTAVCISEDRGVSWSLLERTDPGVGEPELLAVAV
jgi:hypothetical protein